jgi:hypothetical protein
MKQDLESALTTIKHKGQGFPTKPTPPTPAPRWTLSRLGDNGITRERTFRFDNLMPDSVVVGARVELKNNSANALQWRDEGYWPDLSGKTHGDFTVHLRDEGAYKGFELRLTWYDENLDVQYKDFWVNASEDDPNPHWDATPF